MGDQGLKPAEILLVEDNPDDVEITLRAFRKVRMANKVHVVRDGQQALDLLLHTGDYGIRVDAPQPDLVLLDLNLPKLTGWKCSKGSGPAMSAQLFRSSC